MLRAFQKVESIHITQVWNFHAQAEYVCFNNCKLSEE